MGLKGGKFDNSNRKCQAETNSDILGLGSRSLFLHIIIYYRPSVVAVSFHLTKWFTRYKEVKELSDALLAERPYWATKVWPIKAFRWIHDKRHYWIWIVYLLFTLILSLSICTSVFQRRKIAELRDTQMKYRFIKASGFAPNAVQFLEDAYEEGQKGGVGKSTLCILLADYLAYWKKDVCIIDTDLQQSASLQREQDRQTFGEDEPYSIQSFEVTDPMTMQMLMENAQSQDGFVLFDAPGTIKDDGLAPMFIYADYIICPFEYESKSLSSTRTFIQVINQLRQLNPQMKAQIFFVPNKVDARMGTREELELWKQTDAEFAQSGIVAPPVGYRAQMKRVNTYNVPLPLKHAVYESFRFIVKSILR